MVSVPVYFAGKVLEGGRASFGEALVATLGGAVAYYIVYFIIDFFLAAVIGPPAGALALILGLVVWLAVFRSAFHTSWLKAVGIVVLAWVILLILDFVFVSIFGVSFPEFWPF